MILRTKNDLARTYKMPSADLPPALMPLLLNSEYHAIAKKDDHAQSLNRSSSNNPKSYPAPEFLVTTGKGNREKDVEQLITWGLLTVATCAILGLVFLMLSIRKNQRVQEKLLRLTRHSFAA